MNVSDPALIAVATVVRESPETREEDDAAIMQAAGNVILAVVERGLGTPMLTGAVVEHARRAGGADFTEVVRAFHSMADARFTPFRTAGSLMSDTA